MQRQQIPIERQGGPCSRERQRAASGAVSFSHRALMQPVGAPRGVWQRGQPPKQRAGIIFEAGWHHKITLARPARGRSCYGAAAWRAAPPTPVCPRAPLASRGSLAERERALGVDPSGAMQPRAYVVSRAACCSVLLRALRGTRTCAAAATASDEAARGPASAAACQRAGCRCAAARPSATAARVCRKTPSIVAPQAGSCPHRQSDDRARLQYHLTITPSAAGHARSIAKAAPRDAVSGAGALGVAPEIRHACPCARRRGRCPCHRRGRLA